MPKFRKKPVVIEAFKYVSMKRTGEEVRQGVPDHYPMGQEFENAVCHKNDASWDDRRPHIHTLEGHHEVTPGDWIIKGIAGEFYPCKSAIFEATYERVEG